MKRMLGRSATQLVWIASIALMVGAAHAHAQTPAAAPLELTRLTKPVTIDGVPNEDAWRDVPELPLTLYTPVFRGTPTQRSVIRVAYDDGALYAAGWFYDTQPSGIRINSLYRDRWNGDDAFAIYVDAFHDKRNAKWFGITPASMRFDVLLSDDGATSNGNWDTFWTAKSTVTDSGWFSEVRIPFSSLGFRTDADGKVVMGLTVTRVVSRLDERVTFPAIDPKFEFRRPSQAQDVVLRDVHSRTPLYVTPYALTGVARTVKALPTDANRFGADRRTSNEVGLDVRYPLSGNLTLDLTANTDFAQAEADDQQVNLDRFPLFYPERRRFFQEGSGIFDFVAGNNVRLFNSRRIGLTAAQTPVPVVGGARLVGRAGAWDVGALGMQTEPQRDIGAPRESFGVLRARHPVLNAYSTLGGMLTTYTGGGRTNLALGGDGTLRVHGDDYVSFHVAGTHDGRDTSDVALAKRSLVDVRVERRTGRGLQYNAQLTRADAAFAPELGFLGRRDFTTANIAGNYFIFTEKSRYFRRVYPGALAFSTFRNADHALESAQYAVWVEWDTKAGGGGWVEPKAFHENVLTPFTISGSARVPAGRYDFADLQLVYQMPSGQRLRTNVDFRSGSYFDGWRAQAILTPTWNVSSHLELGTDYQLTALRFPSRDERATIQVARLRLRAALDARSSGNAFVQYNSTTRRVDANVRLRHAIAEGTDLWIVYNEALDADRTHDVGMPMPPLSRARTLLMKYTHTFGLTKSSRAQRGM